MAVPGKASQKGCYGTGMWNSPCCLTEESLSHADNSKWSYLVALGTPRHLLEPRAVLKDTQYHLGEFAVRITAKPWVICKSHLPEIQQVTQCSLGCILCPVPTFFFVTAPWPQHREGRRSVPVLSRWRNAGSWVMEQRTFSHEPSVTPPRARWWWRYSMTIKCRIFCPVIGRILSFTAWLYVA